MSKQAKVRSARDGAMPGGQPARPGRESPPDWLGIQKCGEARECIRSHVQDGSYGSGHQRRPSQQGPEAMKQLTQLLPEDLRKELYELWEEYETQSSAEARFVKQLDRCEMILQASEYENLESKPGRLQDFYDSTAGKFSHPEIVQLVSELEAERNANIAAPTSELSS
ncbi:5'-deoxynucleotidase HDDC2 isoform X3 [Mirounga angustirostris]|uniref:5'-deoxynucleotidase HDDC2 isoform X3 n=1 Tax=Mirounga angustirostris TaxID=9716 RepID=UPI00313EFCCE